MPTIIYVPIFSVVVISYFIYRFKRKKTITVPSHWHQILIEHVLFYTKLNGEEQQIFQVRMSEFLTDVTIEGVHIQLEEKDHIYIAASAIIPIFGFKDWKYPNLHTVLIYPDYFNEELQFDKGSKNRNIAGFVGTGNFEHHLVLSKRALDHGFENKTDKQNTAIHEFVHLIDMLDGNIDGIPEELMCDETTLAWLNMMHNKMEAINKKKSDIRHYGGTSKTEFFAVASEYFFERPDLLEKKHPDLYQMLSKCFKQF